MKLSIFIPCYNEVRAAPVADKETDIVDDCSIDGTRDQWSSPAA